MNDVRFNKIGPILFEKEIFEVWQKQPFLRKWPELPTLMF